MSATLFYLLHSPSRLARLRGEIDTTFPTADEIRVGHDLSSCTYLRACIDETLRLTPPIAGVLPREVLQGGMDIDGVHFPAGVDVGTSAYALHRSGKYFPDPLSFRPERWIPAGGIVSEESVALAQSAFCPFSRGPRGCSGKGMAYSEMMMILARTLRLFDVRLGDETAALAVGGGKGRVDTPAARMVEFATKDKFVAGHDGPFVAFRARSM